MQMLRFLRRVFIILILLIIVFFIFRFIKPEATSRFVDKVKNIPTTISSRFHREKKSEIIINGNTTSSSSNFEINENNDDEYDNEIYIPVVVDEDNNEIDNETVENEDNEEIKNSWLEELNKELDKIMATGNNTENIGISETWNSNNVQITENTWNTLPSWFVVIDVEQPYTWTNQNNTQTGTTTNTATNTWNSTQTNATNSENNNPQNNNSTTSTTTNQQQCWRCSIPTEWNCLSDRDCDQMVQDLWNWNIIINK